MYRCYVLLILAALLAAPALAQDKSAGDPVSLRQTVQADPMVRLASRIAPQEEWVLDQVWHRTWNEDHWQEQARTLFVYNGTFRTEEWSYVTNGTALVNDTRTLYTYDGNQRLATATEQVWDAGSENFLPSSRDRHFYVGDATIATDVQYEEWDAEENEFVPVDRQTFTVHEVDGQAYITAGESYVWNGESWDQIDQFVLLQDGDDVVYMSQEWDGAAFVNTERIIYDNITIPDLYARLQQFMEDLDELQGTMLVLRLPDALHQSWDGSQWVNETRQETTSYYDLFTGAILSTTSVSETWEVDEWIPESRVEVKYELTGFTSRPDSLWFEVAMEDDWLTLLQEAFEYDQQGRMQHVYTAMMSGSGELEPQSWTTLFWTEVGTGIEDQPLVKNFTLEPAYPNPFNPSTTLTFRASTGGDVRVQVYDALGRRVATLVSGWHPAGDHTITFDAGALPSGTYLVRLEAPGATLTRSVTLLK